MTHRPLIQRRQVLAAAAAAALGYSLPAQAQSDFPSRPIKVIIPLPAGGAADVAMRAIAVEAEKTLKQPVVIDNKPGGLFQIAVQAVLSGPADGYSLLYMYSGMVSTQAIQKSFDLARQFDPVTELGESPTMLVVGPNSRLSTLKDLVEFGRANPDKLTCSNVGPGSLEHLKTFELTKAAGFTAVHVPYKGGPDAVKAVIGGEVDFIITPAFFAAQFAPKGQMKVLAAMNTTRWAGLPDVPTIREAGVNVPPFNFWTGLLVKAGTPAAITQRLHREIAAASLTPSVKAVLASAGSIAAPSRDPEDLRKRIVAEAASMGELAKLLNLQAN
jgi:tripartite-type tricarboxylate transporter receptor subunit TctC